MTQGEGGISPGEGVYRLRREFAITGSQSQVISLWTVDDQGTKDLMVKYYQRLLDGNIGRTEALRQTQLEMLRGKRGKSTLILIFGLVLFLLEIGDPFLQDKSKEIKLNC